ncbi:GNAT family N-acetyltransferase [Allostreptomyces psammosilenae]|uniref:RimJ/RimL family protein N-acetyltransferase n=1 Tax=Allostreptomyces psammosilenae TaxID=1892865 RepID=A0A852ZSW5_9ACTN|nr:GNAT family N-acetyltransferase [Allostreptomyces psammosilenae]NYI03904.1 RimJ/RimL family protein N-acetyltransferase [Allostreptomyces psammosilenae]
MADPDVRLRVLDEETLPALLACAVADADPAEVMPVPDDGAPPGWTPARRRAFLDFHRSRALVTTGPPVETTYLVVVDGRVAGAARLRAEEQGTALETGVWIGRSDRGRGIGGRVAELLLAEAARSGARRLDASTTVRNVAARRLLRRAGAELREEADGEVRATVPLPPAPTARQPGPRRPAGGA